MVNNKVFISHASSDYRDIDGHVIKGNAISEIMKVLDDNKIERWIDESCLISSKGWCQQIEDAINECNIFLFVSSENANSSVNIANEIAYALEHKKHIIPVKLDKSQYHKDVRLNLIRIHYLRYYEDRNKALRDIVSTINNIKSSTVIVDTLAKIGKIPNEKRVEGEFLSDRLLAVFNAKGIDVAVNNLKSLVRILGCESETGYNSFTKYLQRLDSLSEERNFNVRQSRIERLVSDIKEDKPISERSVSLLIIILKMFLYFCLDDIREVVLIQKEIDEVKFELSYIERNADTINDVANATIRGATFVASVAATLMGKGGSTARASMVASTKGEKITIVKTSQKINNQKRTFELFRLALQTLYFVDN